MDDRALTHRKPQLSSTSPDNERNVAGLIARLLLHFWAPADLSEAARKAMAQDWLYDLREFGPEVVAEACSRWRRTETKRPTPADIRRFCIEEQAERQDAARPLALPSPEQRAAAAADKQRRDDQMIREGRAAADKFAQQHGYDTIEAYATGERIGVGAAYVRVVNSVLAGSPVGRAGNPAAALGITAREYKPSAEQLAAARRELGIDHSLETE